MAPDIVPALRSFKFVSISTALIAAICFCNAQTSAQEGSPTTDKPSVLLQAGVSHSTFLPPLKMSEIDKQINRKATPDKIAPEKLPQPVQRPAKDPTQSLRKELGNLNNVDRATAYQKLLNLSAQKNKKPPPPALYASPPATAAIEKPKPPLKAKVEALKKDDAQRYEVPDWLAGVWQRTQMTETKRTSLPGNLQQKTSGTSTAVVTDAFGTYRDKNGRIYQLFDSHAPSGQVDRGATLDVEHVFDYRLKVLDNKRVVVQAKAWHVQLGKFDKRLITAYQDEEFNVYTSLGPGKLRTDSSVKVFDKTGKATLLTQSYSSETRIRKP